MAEEENNPVKDFERSMGELEALVQQLESGDLSLEQALAQFERGVTLSRQCQRALRDAELKVETLIKDNGEYKIDAYNQPDPE